MINERRTRWRPRLAPALITDLPVLLAFVACWVLVPVGWAHIASGIAMAGLVIVHMQTRHRILRRLRRRPWPARRSATQVSSWLVIAAAAAITVTGFMRWAGMEPDQTWHGGSGWLLLTAISAHLWVIRHRLFARMNGGASPRRVPQPAVDDRAATRRADDSSAA